MKGEDSAFPFPSPPPLFPSPSDGHGRGEADLEEAPKKDPSYFGCPLLLPSLSSMIYVAKGHPK